MEINKPNDILVTLLLTPDANVFDLNKSNINPDNTSLFDKETYKNSDFVKKAFTDSEGKFNDEAFNNAYLKASELYLESSNDKYLVNALEWDENNLMRPVGSKTFQPTAKIVKDIDNPEGNVYGRTSFNSIDKGDFSARELAQKSKVIDYKTGKEFDFTPNDLGYLGSLTNETLVYASYDEDGVHVDESTGREISHKKGEWKTNKLGKYYTENLGNREVYGKQIVNPSDLITTDGSSWNKVDFWDSDGLSKSTTGTIMKLSTEIAPYLIPYFNLYYGGFKAATTMSSIMPTIYKSLEGVVLGESTIGNETDLWKAATKAEGFAARFNTDSFSDNASKSMMNTEQIGSMIGSIFGQIYEQRAAASLSKMFFKLNNPKYTDNLINVASKELDDAVAKGLITTKTTAKSVGEAAQRKVMDMSGMIADQSKLSAKLSTAYMAITSSANMYEDALAAGYDRRTAGLAAFGAMVGQYGIMSFNNNRMQTWFLDKGVGYDESVSGMRSALKSTLDDIEKAIKPLAGSISKEEQKRGVLSKIVDLKNFFGEALSNPGKQAIYKNSLIEGFEEVTEQAVLDTTKGMIDALSWLGITQKQGSFDAISNVFSQKGLETYLSNLLGGMVGGSLFEINRLKIEPFFTGKAIPPETKYSMINMIANGKAKELKEEATKMVKAMGNTSLSPIATDVNGEKIYLTDENASQADIVVGAIHKYIDYLDDIMNSENLKHDDASIIRKTILDQIKEEDLEKTGIHKFILSDFNELSDEIITLKSSLSNLDKEKDGESISQITSKLKEKREELQLLLAGEKAGDYKGLTLFSLNSTLYSPFLSLNVADYARDKYNVDYNSLPKDSGELNKIKLDEEFNLIVNTPDNIKDKMKYMYSNFKKMLENYSNLIGEYGEENHIQAKQEFTDLLQTSGMLTSDNIYKYADLLKKYPNLQPNLDDKLNFPLGDLLLDNGFIDMNNLSSEQLAQQVESLNNFGQAFPFKNISPKFIQDNIDVGVNSELNRIQSARDLELSLPDSNQEEVQAKYLAETQQLLESVPKLLNKNSEEVLPLDLFYFVNELEKKEVIPSNLLTILKDQRNNIFKSQKESVKITETLLNKILLENVIDSDIHPEEMFDEIVDIFNKLNTQYISTNTLEELNNWTKEVNIIVQSSQDIYRKYMTEEDFESPEEFNQNINNFNSILTELTSNIKPINNSLLEKADKVLSKKTIEDKFFDILNKIHIDVFKGGVRQEVKILDIIRPEISKFESASDRPQDYVRTADAIKDMKEALNTLRLMHSINAAMLNSSADKSIPYSFNYTLQQIAEKKKEDPSVYKVIDAQTYDSLRKEIINVENKLNFLIELAEANSGSIWANEEAIKDNTIKLKINALSDKNNPSSAINLEIKGRKLLPEDEFNRINNLKISDEEKLWQLEDIVYTTFTESYTNNDPTEALNEIYTKFEDPKFIESLFHPAGTGLVKNQKALDNIDYFIYLHSVLSTKNEVFYNKYKKVLEKELSLDDKKAPFYTQENAIKLIYNYLQNKGVMNKAMSFLKTHTKKEGGTSYSERAILDNLFLVVGSGGVGKTSVISNFVLRMLQDEADTDFYVSASDSYVLKKLKKEASKQFIGKLEGVTETELLTKLLDKDLYNEYISAQNLLLDRTSKEDVDNFIGSDTNPINGKTFPETNSVIEIGKYNGDEIHLTELFKSKLLPINKKIVIFADEISYFSPIGLQIINHIASLPNSNLFLIGSGDNFQDSFVLSENNPYSIDHIHFISPPKLKGVIRGKNIHKKDNNENLEILVKKIVNNEEVVVDAIKTLSYFQNETTLHGDKLVDTLELSDLKTLNPTLETAVITNDGTIDPETKAKIDVIGFTNIKIVKRTEVKGEEFDQVISMVNLPIREDFVSKSVGVRRFYTLLTRAKVATLVVGNKEIISTLGIKNEARKTTSSIELDQNNIEEELKKRLDLINSNFKESNIKKKIITVTPKSDSIDLGDNEVPDSQLVLETPPTIEEEKSKDGDNRFFSYSFYNVLHANADSKEIVLKPNDGIPSDLQVLEMLYGSSDLEDNLKNKKDIIINDFIQLKNTILHNFTKDYTNKFKISTKNSFGKLDLSKGSLVIRKLYMDDNFVKPFGKQAHKKDKNGKSLTPEKGEYLFVSYKGKHLGKDFYITLSSLPSVYNANWNQEKNKEYLKTISDSLQVGQDIPLTNKNFEVYSGIQFIDINGTIVKSTKNSEVHTYAETYPEFLKLLQERSPGIMVQNTDEIPVFENDPKKVAKEFNKVGYNFGSKSKIKETLPFTNRPYIKVSYVDANNDTTSRIIILNARKRSILQAVEEYKNLKTINKGLPKQETSEFLMLISNWDGIQLYNKLESTEQEQVRKFAKNRAGKGSADIETFTDDAFDLIAKLKDSKSDGKGGIDYSKLTIEERNTLLKNGKVLKNVGLMILDLISENKIKKDRSDKNTVEFLQQEKYYNSKFWFEKGESGKMFLPKEFIKYFEIPFFLEPPMFIMDLNNLEKNKQEEIKEPIVSSEELELSIVEGDIINLDILGEVLPINVTEWINPNNDYNNLGRVISILLEGLETLESDVLKYGQTKSISFTDEQFDKIKNYIKDFVSNQVLPLSTMINQNGFNGGELDKQYNYLFKSIKGEDTAIKGFFHEAFKLKAKELSNITKKYIGKESKYKINKIC